MEQAQSILTALLPSLVELRHLIHSKPDLSLQEHDTAARVTEYISAHLNKSTVKWDVRSGIGGAGVVITINSGVEGETLLFRSELDALPIDEPNDIPYRSTRPNISHKCGHDGHMAILCGLGAVLAQNPPAKGRVMLLFQPAEEIGVGARAMLQDGVFKEVTPDRVFALHNLPGFKKGTVVVRSGTFASASRGISIKFKGVTAHACSPHLGNAPTMAVAHLMQALPGLSSSVASFEHAVLVTIVYACVGQKRFGTAPGEGEVCATLRTHTNEDMELLMSRATEISNALAVAYNLSCTIEYDDIFAATINNAESVEAVSSCATKLGLAVHQKEHPFAWSEDFGEFLAVQQRGCMFGLGADEEDNAAAPLHRDDFNFNDDLIESGVVVFLSQVDRVLGFK